ncbi:hypothetical protein GQ44DRAFT_624695 [Phaeosphaeriaceae sp. PMI808]|nr:hypothetical protein GQ44DRAFT_624695 [Phaeosphaeriaceae sp. PMI808]
MDWDDFQTRARNAIPSQELKPKRCWIGVLSHEKSAQEQFMEADFVWMIGHHKITLQKVYETYESRHRGLIFDLKFKDIVVGNNDTIKSFLEPNNDLVLQMAIKDERQPSPVPSHLDEDTQDTQVEVEFDPENVFERESSLDQDSQEEIRPTDRSIRSIIAQQDPSMLEAGVAQSVKVLQDLKLCFSPCAETIQDARTWIQAIDKLIPQAERKRTIVGVVGNTGAGKSSVINAMLDEERLVPTNCMRACTAVVTEISWNSSDDNSCKYRAEIEFISRDDWSKELSILMKEFLTETGNVSREASDQNSDAGIAWAKFHSVYPKRSRDSLSDCTVDDLMAEKGVLDVLNTTKKINSAYPDRFYQSLQRYVDSKEKVTKQDKDKEKSKEKKSFGMEYWPLIKVVKIYVKAESLSTGAVIVDLPGVHDSNAARAAVAQGYMKQCTGLWIVAPINRAVDDKAAKTLLGESFKRQLKYDGGFSNITFICSKTDDISITEATDTLGLDDEVEKLYEQKKHFKTRIEEVEEEIEVIRESQDICRATKADASQEIETWEELQESLENGKVVYAPTARHNKRKNADSEHGARKKHRKTRDESVNDFVISDEEDVPTQDDSDIDSEDVQAPRIPLAENDVKNKLKILREKKKAARRESLELTAKIKDLRPQIKDLNERIAAINAEINHICIAGRNEYSRGAIQQDFAAGIKELDQENAAEEDEENFNPDEELRDYDKVAKSLPVFCVSSRAYQKMCGRLQKDATVPGFKIPDETEVPQLQAHCKKLTEAGRIQTARTFLLNLCQQLTTFSLWASDDGTGLKLTDDDKRKQVRYLEKRLGELERGLEESVRACIHAMKREMDDHIFNKYPALINEAMTAAPETAQKWGAHRSDGGLMWGTYKAIVRRDGQYHSATAGHRDFNADLVNPIVKKLATGWERTFQSKLPKIFEAFIKASSRLLHNFHEAIEERARNNGMGLASLAALKTQIYTYEQLFADLNQVLIFKMTELQREANRDFTPTIADIMHTAYERCAEEFGKGSFLRMKTLMSDHVDQSRVHMFNDATLTVKHHLDSMCKTLEEVMEEKADEIYINMKADYVRALGGGQTAIAILPHVERMLRSEVMKQLRTVDAKFEPIARGDLEDESTADDVNIPADENTVFDNDTEMTELTPSKNIASNQVREDSVGMENNDMPMPTLDSIDEQQ